MGLGSSLVTHEREGNQKTKGGGGERRGDRVKARATVGRMKRILSLVNEEVHQEVEATPRESAGAGPRPFRIHEARALPKPEDVVATFDWGWRERERGGKEVQACTSIIFVSPFKDSQCPRGGRVHFAF